MDEAPDDDATRQSYNVAPGYFEPVYRADVPDRGAESGGQHEDATGATKSQEDRPEGQPETAAKGPRYKLQAMKWGLIPFWTKRNPDYGSMMKTINCRDDSLKENRGMWTSMKQKKRCIVVCQGFYEWLKKSGGKEKVPHFVRRKDDQLMCFAGLWDCVQYEGSDEKLYTYTIITTDSSEQLKFLHDRMPVILENGSEQIRTWLDPKRSAWSAELQSLLKPYKGDLDVYAVRKDVGKVGNSSPAFIVPVSSSDNKQNIVNFFGNAKGRPRTGDKKQAVIEKAAEPGGEGVTVDHQEGKDRKTIKEESGTVDSPPAPVPLESDQEPKSGVKRRLGDDDDDERGSPAETKQGPRSKVSKREGSEPAEAISSGGRKVSSTGKRTRNATSNEGGRAPRSSPRKTAATGSKKITGFFSR